MNSKEKLIQDLHNITVNTESGEKKIGQVTKYWHLDAIAQFIIEDRKRICEPLIRRDHGDYNYELMEAIKETLKLAGLGDEK